MKKLEVIINKKRIDQYLMEELDLSRSKIQKMISQNLVLLNGSPVKNSTSVKMGDILEVGELEEEEMNAEAENIPLDIV